MMYMTEKDFWMFLKKALEEGGRMDQVSGILDTGEKETQETSEYIGGHSILPNHYDKIPKDTIIAMGELLLQEKVNPSTKQAILMILAHHGSDAALNFLKRYNKNPDECLRYYARLALDECRMWMEDN